MTVCVYLPARIFQKCCRGLAILWRHRDMLCISGFMDNAILSVVSQTRRRKQGVCSKWLNMGQLRTGGEVWCLRIPCVWLTTNFSYSVTVSLTNMVFRWTLQEHVEKAIALNPKDPTNYYLLGRWCYGVCTLRACVAHRFQSNHVMQFFTHVHFAIMLICCNKLLNV